MNPLPGLGHGHHSPDNYEPNLYKVLFTKAQPRINQDAQGKDIILNTAKRVPIVEATVDLKQNKVVKIANPPTQIR